MASSISGSRLSSPSSRPISTSVSASSIRPDQAVVGAEVVGDHGQLGVDLLGPLLVVPEVGAAGLGLELGQPGPQLLDAEVDARLVEAATEVADGVGEVAHRSSTGPRSAVAELELLAAAARARARCGASCPSRTSRPARSTARPTPRPARGTPTSARSAWSAETGRWLEPSTWTDPTGPDVCTLDTAGATRCRRRRQRRTCVPDGGGVAGGLPRLGLP